MIAGINHSIIKLSGKGKGYWALSKNDNTYSICTIRYYTNNNSTLCTQICCLM